jgi:succinate dehydrogenase/fumarate reductase flavoprotein subunit
MITTLDQLGGDETFDLVVVGSGAVGMAATLFAAIDGLKVLLVERTEYLGGTSALSAATTWIPNNRHSTEVSPDDSIEKAARFLDGVVGNYSPADLRMAFLESGPEAVATLEDNSEVKFRPYATHPDYEQDVEGATMRGRAMEPVPFDGRRLGADLNAIRPPIPEFTLFDGMMIDRTDIGHLLNLTKSLKSFRHAASILTRYGFDKLAGRRGSRLVMGNALIGQMLASLNTRKVPILTKTTVKDLIAGANGVEAIDLVQGSASRRVKVRKGVVLAAGGFNRHPTRRAEFLPEPTPVYSPAAPGHTGEMQDIALRLGARFGEGNWQPAFWAPVSVRKRKDGTTAVFPHFVLDRSKPGTVCVDQTGKRFVNESTSYHRFGKAMFEANRTSPTIPCYIITDAPSLKKYGLGMVRMGTKDPSQFVADGYLVKGDTIADLAGKLDIPAAALEATIAEMNAAAASGEDPAFGRGTTAYHRVNGDATRGTKNPTLGPISTAPYYAVRLYPGDIGAATGLVINADAEVLGAGNQPIGNLYACGNEANSIMGGLYPGPGITIGPGITFAFRAVRHARTKDASRRSREFAS